MRRWLAHHRVDQVMMYVFEGNDLDGLDERYPCCEWQSLLVYPAEGPMLRCPNGPRVDFENAGFWWILYNSPPPYILRALIPYSHAAAHVAAAILNQFVMINSIDSDATPEQHRLHLEAILRAAHDELAEKGIGLAVVAIPTRSWVENQANKNFPDLIAMSRRLGIPCLDLSDPLRAAAAEGRSPLSRGRHSLQ
jgi:hypothetical protein